MQKSTHHDSESIINQVDNFDRGGYIRHEVRPDGGGVYTTFEIEPEYAHQRIIDNINEVRDIIQVALYEQLLLEKFYLYLQRQGLVNENVSHKYIIDNIEMYAQDPIMISAYIDYDLKERNIDAGWAHPAILQALSP